MTAVELKGTNTRKKCKNGAVIKMDIRAMRALIAKEIDLSKTRLKADEVKLLFDFIKKYASLAGKTIMGAVHTYTGYASDGKYTQTERTSWTFLEKGIGIVQTLEFQNDDGTGGKREVVLKLSWESA